MYQFQSHPYTDMTNGDLGGDSSSDGLNLFSLLVSNESRHSLDSLLLGDLLFCQLQSSAQKRKEHTSCSSTSTLTSLTPGYFSSILAKWGEIILHGPHQVAQKSTTTGSSPLIWLSADACTAQKVDVRVP
jgi:hypothetical protein